MGTWQKELDKVCAQSETNKKFIEKQQKYYQKIADAAQTFLGGWTKANAQFTKTLSELLDLAEQAAKPAAELMVLEDELTIAEDFGDKAEIKKVEAKMKPLPEDEKNPLANKAHHDDLILWLVCKEAKTLIFPGK